MRDPNPIEIATAQYELEAKRELSTNELTAEVIAYLLRYTPFCKRVNSQGIRGRKSRNKGAADIRCILPFLNGRSLDIEIKARKGDKLNPDQVKFKDEVIRAGGEFWEIKTFEEFEIKFKELRK